MRNFLKRLFKDTKAKSGLEEFRAQHQRELQAERARTGSSWEGFPPAEPVTDSAGRIVARKITLKKII